MNWGVVAATTETDGTQRKHAAKRTAAMNGNAIEDGSAR